MLLFCLDAIPGLVALQSAGEAAVSEHADGGRALLCHEPRDLVQAQPGHLLPVHLQDLVSDPQQAGVELLRAAVPHLLHVHTCDTGGGPSVGNAPLTGATLILT